MQIAERIEQLVADGALLADAAERAGWDAPVPATSWNVRELVTHVGGVHRWAADIVARGGHSFDTASGDAVGTGPDDGELLAWFRGGHAELVETLRAAPPDLDCAVFLPAPSPLAFWARRQAHETAIHRADAEGVAGPVTPFPAPFAQDGIDELLTGFAARRNKAVNALGSISVAASDGPSWLVTLGGERIVAREDDSRADATVSGTSSDLYLWLWNRPSAAVVSGDEAIANLWRGVRVSWG
jgi:uncharacterized protein (TIGR03083 family)